MSKDEQILAWAESWHYPQLVLSDKDIIRHGEAAWKAFAADRGRKRKLLAWDRIAKWEQLINKQSA